MGYGLLRSLRASDQKYRLIGTDIYSHAVGQAWCDTFEQAPLTSAVNYDGWLLDVVRRHAVCLIIPGIEQDIYHLPQLRNRLFSVGCRVALNRDELVEICSDKWAMYETLVRLKDPSAIPTSLSRSFDELNNLFGLPFIVKPRRGYASKGLVRVREEGDFLRLASDLGASLLAQPVVGSDDDEYTVGVFGDGTGKVCAYIALKRKLAADGSTAQASVYDNAFLRETVNRLCAHFRPIGPTNLQFRRVDDNWFLLEINPRISSTLSIRRAFGYDESAMCVDFFLSDKTISQPAVRAGFAARYIEDYVIYDRNNF